MNNITKVFKTLQAITVYFWFAVLLPFRTIKYVLILVSRLYQYLWGHISKRLHFSITFKTTSMYAIIFSVVLAIFSIMLSGAFGAFLIFTAKASLERNGRVIANEISQSTKLPEQRIKNYAITEDITISMFDNKGDMIYTAYPSEAAEVKGTIQATIQDRTSLSPNVWFDRNFEFLNIMLYTGFGSEIDSVQISKSVQRELAYLITLMLALIIFSIIAILITSVIGFWNGRKMLKPIDKMTRTARSISASDLTTRLDIVRSHDELKEMAETFNSMLDRIELSYEQQRMFVSDASHELRTPISVIQGYTNLLRRWGRNDPDVVDEAIDAISNEADHMKDLVEKLLFLARTEQNTQQIEVEEFSLHDLIDEILQETRILDDEHTVTSDKNEVDVISADKRLIKQALRIFIDNSMKYTPACGKIHIDSSKGGGKAIITIEDTGVGIAKDELPHIFNRFYRCDKSRNRSSGGTGLGLSIAKWIIEEHQGTIKVQSTVGEGTKITVILPLI